MANHRATGRAQMRPLAPNGRGTHRDSAAVSAGIVKVGVLGALATATIAVPLASATASQHGVAAGLPGSLQGAQPAAAQPAAAQAPAALPAAAQPVAIPVTAVPAEVAPGSSALDLKASAPEPEVVAVAAVDGIDESAAGDGYIRPVSAPVTSGYGWRVHPVLHYRKLHDGMDFGAACGTPVKAVKGGTVVMAQRAGASGNRLEIDHGNGVVTGYFHLQGFEAKVGDTVSQGEVIGEVGSTGRSTGCHLHFAKMDESGAYSNPASLFG